MPTAKTPNQKKAQATKKARKGPLLPKANGPSTATAITSSKPEGSSIGRASTYVPTYAKVARQMSWLGQSNTSIGKALGVDESTVRAWADTFPAFGKALAEGRESADYRTVRSLYERANGYKHKAVKIFKGAEDELIYAPYVEHFAPDTSAAIFWLKNRRPEQWKDKTDHEVNVNLMVRRQFLELALEEEAKESS
jgi:hypothetical protein